MTRVSLENTNISETYKGVLHAAGTQLPFQSLQNIYDGSGVPSSIAIGRAGAGMSVTGGITTTGSILLSSTITDNITAYPRIQFGEGGLINSYPGTSNTDNVFITRLDNRWNRSELRINLGDDIVPDSKDIFTIGGTSYLSAARGFIPVLSLSGNGNMTVQLPQHENLYINPVNWQGGITSFDFYSDGGTFGTGTGGSLIAYFNKDGDFVGRTFSSRSSIQYKSNVKPLENALDIINKLEGVRFDWKDTGQSDIGLIAESVEEVLPEFVMKDKDTGKPQGVDYGKITAVLIEAVKELTKLVVK